MTVMFLFGWEGFILARTRRHLLISILFQLDEKQAKRRSSPWCVLGSVGIAN
jgi:hypothetical protein